MMAGVNYVKYGCSSARTTPAVSIYRSVTLEKILLPLLLKTIDGNLKKQIKS